MSPPDLKPLERATSGLTLASESDEPVEPIRWDDAANDLDAPAVARLAGLAPGTAVERTDAADLLRDAYRGPDAARFRDLVAAIERLVEPGSIRGYRAGDVEKDVFLVGRLPGGAGWAGVRSKVVET